MSSDAPDAVKMPAPPDPSTPAEPTGEPTGEPVDAASVYEEQKRLEHQEADRLLDATIDVSGDTSGEDEIPEEILLNSSTESGGVPCPPSTTAITTNSEHSTPRHKNSFATQSESDIAGPSLPNIESEDNAIIAVSRPPVLDAMDSVSGGAPRIIIPGEYYAIKNARKALRAMPNWRLSRDQCYAWKLLPGRRLPHQHRQGRL